MLTARNGKMEEKDMGEITGIDWTRSSWSPWWGCTKVSVGDKGACVECYAEAFDKRVGGDHWGWGKPRRDMSDNHWAQPRKWDRAAAASGEDHTVFPSMCDPFDNEVGAPLRTRFYDLMRETPNLTWLLLTKRPQNIIKLSEEAGGLPANAAIGCTVVTQKEADRDIPHLIRADARFGARFTFLSVEPMMEAMDIREWLKLRIDWVICGGESGPRPRPMHPDWVRSLRDQCVAAGVPFFFKQWGGRTPKANGKELDGREWCELPAPKLPRAA